MNVSCIARELAEAVIAARPALTPRQRLLLELLRLLPLYNDIENVAIWDDAYHAAMPLEDDNSEIGCLVQAIYDFATETFYGAFESEEARNAYEFASRYLRDAGIDCPAVECFTGL
jgi:hypothetical protein